MSWQGYTAQGMGIVEKAAGPGLWSLPALES
jgi:hypothetical protein